MGIEISLCMIVKNEEHNLGNCLATVHDLVDEIIIIDTGSTDKTIEIASEYTDKIYHFEWINDFSAARNYSFSKATKEYIMWLDADDIINEENRQKILDLKETLDKEIDVVIMDYHYAFDDAGNLAAIQPRERLLKRSKNFKWRNVVHEHIYFGQEIEFKSLRTDIYIIHAHKTVEVNINSLARNLQIIERAIEGGTYSFLDVLHHGLTLYALNRNDEALEALNKYFVMIRKKNEPPRVNAYTTAHEIYLKRGDFENAYQILVDNENYLKDKSEYQTALGDFARLVLKDYESACHYYEKAVKCEGTEFMGVPAIFQIQEYYYFRPYYNLGICYNKLRRHKEAQEAFEKAAEYKETEELKIMLEKIKRINELLKNQN